MRTPSTTRYNSPVTKPVTVVDTYRYCSPDRRLTIRAGITSGIRKKNPNETDARSFTVENVLS